MSLDRRLHHAARDLREVAIEPPPFEHVLAGRVRVRRMPSLVAPMLFVLGGLVVASGVTGGLAQPDERNVPDQTDLPVATDPSSAPDVQQFSAPAPISALDEMLLIADLAPATPVAIDDPSTPDVLRAPPGVI